MLIASCFIPESMVQTSASLTRQTSCSVQKTCCRGRSVRRSDDRTSQRIRFPLRSTKRCRSRAPLPSIGGCDPSTCGLLHILKPDPRAYALALEGLDLPAHEVVFIDDQPRNVAGGSAVGIRSFHLDITNPLEIIAQVRLAMSLQEKSAFGVP
jgi:hypothetical protein